MNWFKHIIGAGLILLVVLGAVGSVMLWQDYRPLPQASIAERPAPQSLPPGPVTLRDVTAAAGLRFRHNNGAFGAKWITESLGSGAAFFDYDGDGDADLFLVNGRNWTQDEYDAYAKGPGRAHQEKFGFRIPPNRSAMRSSGALYRNNGNGTFSDATAGSGLSMEIYGFGTAAGDYDNDGDFDLLVSALEGLYLFQNQGQGRFRAVSRELGLTARGWFSSCAFLDYDRDGKLDIFACRYLKWSPSQETPFIKTPAGKAYSGPLDYQSEACALFRNTGRGFVDVSGRAGIALRRSLKASAKAVPVEANALGVAVYDFNRDSWPDIAVASDLKPNLLFRNNRDGTFSEIALQANFVYGMSGKARAGMGIDTGDLSGNGLENIVVGNFSREGMGFYMVEHQQGDAVLYNDVAARYELISKSERFVTFACQFADIDNDGRLDILAANGHVRDDADTNPNFIDHGTITYAQRPLFLWNRGMSRPFADVGFEEKKPQPEIVGRGLATADYDLDGDMDVLFTNLDGPPLLLKNSGTANHAVRIVLQGTKSNRSAIGARIEARIGKTVLRRSVKSGSSYLSQSELPLTVGIGKSTSIDMLTVFWPAGTVTKLQKLPAGNIYTIREDKGLISQGPLRGIKPSR